MSDYRIPTSSSVERSSTFGKDFLKQVISYFPYTNVQDALDIEQLNPKYKHFYNAGERREELIRQRSVSIPRVKEDEFTPSNFVFDKGYHRLLYTAIDQDKSKRLQEYRLMAAYAELANALDEICDEVIVKDDKGEITTIDVDDEHDEQIKEEIKKEYKKFENLFNLEDKGWEYFRTLLVEGELYFENIISEKRPDLGILGIVNIPTELMTPVYDNVQNLIIKSFILRKQILNDKQQVEEEHFVPFDRNQVSYFHSGKWNQDKTIRIPYIENARRAYKQLSLIEDSIVIYRLVRAPERLVFNVDVGNMPPAKAESYMKRLMQQYWTRKTHDASQGGNVNVYDPQSMLDSYWFAKRPGKEGTNVETLQSGQALDKLEDLKYFLKKLYKALKVPSSRLDPDAPYSDGTEITREELKFAKFIIRLQSQFARGLKQSFITHLKLKGLWEQYDLKETDIKVDFNPPTSFYQLREQQLIELKMNNYQQMVNNDFIADSFAQKKYLRYSDQEMKINRTWLKKDASFRWELAQIEQYGPNWREKLEKGLIDDPEAAGSVEPGIDSNLPPDFGPGPEGGDFEEPEEEPEEFGEPEDLPPDEEEQ